MSEWQPAIIVDFHNFGGAEWPDKVFIREIQGTSSDRLRCDAKRWFECKDTGLIVCEHEILTD